MKFYSYTPAGFVQDESELVPERHDIWSDSAATTTETVRERYKRIIANRDMARLATRLIGRGVPFWTAVALAHRKHNPFNKNRRTRYENPTQRKLWAN